MSRINTNIPAIQAVHRLESNHADLNLRLERLATGLQINRARDDPAGLIVSEILRSEMRGIRQAIANSTRAGQVMATAEGALNEVSALLLNLQNLIVEAANEAGLTESEVAANQLSIDSILESIDRIADATTFAGKKLLDGTMAYALSAVPPDDLASVAVFAAHIPHGKSREVTVKMTQSAQTAQVSLVGTNVGGVSQTSAATVEVRGTLGSELLSFADGMDLLEIKTVINQLTQTTGVSAVVSSLAGGGTASALVLNSTTFGTDAFVSVEPISGNFIEVDNANTTIRGTGVDAGVLINGQMAGAKGLRADIRTRQLDLRIYLTPTFGQTLSTTTFSIAGDGAVFQLTPEVKPSGRLFVGLNRLSTTSLGNSVVGLLHSLRSGHENDLASRNFGAAQEIVNEAIDQVASFRGRLGSLEKDHIDTNVNSQEIALENVTASESIIRDADMATEVSALTRAQILVQSTQSTLQIANSIPNMVLSLLK